MRNQTSCSKNGLQCQLIRYDGSVDANVPNQSLTHTVDVTCINISCTNIKSYDCTIGEVIIWDLNKDDDMIVASSGIGDDSHREPVCKVQWIPDPESKGKKYHVSVYPKLLYC